LLRFNTLHYLDRLCTGLEAFSMLLPRGWTFNGGLLWSPNSSMMPASAGWLVSGLNHVEVRAIPGQAFIWTNLRTIQIGFPIGSMYLGAVSCPPLSPADVLKKMIVPSLRGDVAYPLVVEEEHVPIDGTLGFDAQFDTYTSSSAYGNKLRLEYEQNGREMEEEIFCTVNNFEFMMPQQDGEVEYMIWMADNIHSFRAEKGTLDGFSGAFQVMMHSFRLNPLWFDRYNRIVRFLKDHQTDRFSSARQVNDAVESINIHRYANMESYRQRQEVFHWIAEKVGCKKPRTDEYYDPIQETSVRLPCGYGGAWTNGAGEYALSGDDYFTPDAAGPWNHMEKIDIESTVMHQTVPPITGHG
jgi:hypothetical protein